MIGKIKGTLSELEGNVGLIETKSGVYYRVYLPPPLVQGTAVGSLIELYTYLHVKEDGLTLFGFEDKKQQRLFILLLAVDGVGPKLAYSIISYTTTAQLITAIAPSDYHFLNSIPGIGKKTAQKILVELSNKFDGEFIFEKTVLSQDETTIVDALASLGFEKSKAGQIISQLQEELSVEERIKQAIQLMTKK